MPEIRASTPLTPEEQTRFRVIYSQLDREAHEADTELSVATARRDKVRALRNIVHDVEDYLSEQIPDKIRSIDEAIALQRASQSLMRAAGVDASPVNPTIAYLEEQSSVYKRKIPTDDINLITGLAELIHQRQQFNPLSVHSDEISSVESHIQELQLKRERQVRQNASSRTLSATDKEILEAQERLRQIQTNEDLARFIARQQQSHQEELRRVGGAREGNEGHNLSPLAANPELEQQNTLAEWYGQVRGDIPLGNPLLKPNPPESLQNITAEQLHEIETDNDLLNIKPYFKQASTGIIYADPEGNPWTYFQNQAENSRFWNAENIVNKGDQLPHVIDSGLFALSAVSAKDNTEQAHLYKTIAQIVLRIHQRDPGLINKWIMSQLNRNLTVNGQQVSSLDIFITYDKNNAQRQLRTENERLFPYNQNNQLNTSQVQEFWQTRISQLQQALDSNQLKLYQLQWIDFLSHSVNLNEVFTLLKRFQGDVLPLRNPPQFQENNQPSLPTAPVTLEQAKQELVRNRDEFVKKEIEYLSTRPTTLWMSFRQLFSKHATQGSDLQRELRSSYERYLQSRNNYQRLLAISEVQNDVQLRNSANFKQELAMKLANEEISLNQELSNAEMTQILQTPTLLFSRCWTKKPVYAWSGLNLISIGAGIATPWLGWSYVSPAGVALGVLRFAASTTGWEALLHSRQTNISTNWKDDTIQNMNGQKQAQEAAYIYADRFVHKQAGLTDTEIKLLRNYYYDRILDQLNLRTISPDSPDDRISDAIKTAFSREHTYSVPAGTVYDMKRYDRLINPDPNKGFRWGIAALLGLGTTLLGNVLGEFIYESFHGVSVPYVSDLPSSPAHGVSSASSGQISSGALASANSASNISSIYGSSTPGAIPTHQYIFHNPDYDPILLHQSGGNPNVSSILGRTDYLYGSSILHHPMNIHSATDIRAVNHFGNQADFNKLYQWELHANHVTSDLYPHNLPFIEPANDTAINQILAA